MNIVENIVLFRADFCGWYPERCEQHQPGMCRPSLPICSLMRGGQSLLGATHPGELAAVSVHATQAALGLGALSPAPSHCRCPTLCCLLCWLIGIQVFHSVEMCSHPLYFYVYCKMLGISQGKIASNHQRCVNSVRPT